METDLTTSTVDALDVVWDVLCEFTDSWYLTELFIKKDKYFYKS